MENAVCHDGEKQQRRTATTVDMNQLAGNKMTTFLKKHLRWRSRNSNLGVEVKCSHRDATEVGGNEIRRMINVVMWGGTVGGEVWTEAPPWPDQSGGCLSERVL